MEILGVRIDNFNRQEVLQKIEFFLTEDKFHQIATVNPEFILRAQKDTYFKTILNQTDLNIADGVGIWYAFIRHFSFLKCRYAGIDLLKKILEMANEKKLNVFLVLTDQGLSNFAEIKKVIAQEYPQIKLHGGNFNPKQNKKWPVIENCEIVFCNFGFPQQEKFIFQQKNATIRLAMGVGGSFDFLTGKLRRAPKIMRKIGLEWLWRLILEPKYRFRRVWRAFPVFATRVTLNR